MVDTDFDTLTTPIDIFLKGIDTPRGARCTNVEDLVSKIKSLKEAEEIVGGFAKPSKMPGYAYGISAKECHTGRKLRDVKGSVCSVCYALKGNYSFKNVKIAHERRLESLKNNPMWEAAMIYFMRNKKGLTYFRWHDSGDLQSLDHLNMIVNIAKHAPHVKFWLPTREYTFVRQWSEINGEYPENLTIRLSAYMLNGKAPESLAKQIGVAVSGVSDSAFTCPASSQDNQCKDCRACWDRDVFNVSYKQH